MGSDLPGSSKPFISATAAASEMIEMSELGQAEDAGKVSQNNWSETQAATNSSVIGTTPYPFQKQPQSPPNALRNNLLVGVGFLEFGNACDFPANIFNDYPLSKTAIALMVVGASVALFTSQYAFRDARLSFYNVRILRQERRWLYSELQVIEREERTTSNLLDNVRCSLDVNFRELGTELVDRLLMDVFLGFGAVLVSVGTFMAIGGSNSNVFLASNLLSGYIGNAPAAIFAVMNLIWGIFIWKRGNKQNRAFDTHLISIEASQLRLVKQRNSTLRHHALMSAVTALVAGVGSLVSATLWQGYVVLVPCIISSIFLNYFFRRYIGYDRTSILYTSLINKEDVISQLERIATLQEMCSYQKGRWPFSISMKVAMDTNTVSKMVSLMLEADLLDDDDAASMMTDGRLRSILVRNADERGREALDLEACNEEERKRILQAAELCLERLVASRRLWYRQRYLLELLACFMCVSRRTSSGVPATIK